MKWRTAELDPLMDWVEAREAEITLAEINGHGSVPMHNESLSLKAVSRQLWAMLNPLVSDS